MECPTQMRRMGLDYLPFGEKHGHMNTGENGYVNIPYMEHLGTDWFMTGSL